MAVTPGSDLAAYVCRSSSAKAYTAAGPAHYVHVAVKGTGFGGFGVGKWCELARYRGKKGKKGKKEGSGSTMEEAAAQRTDARGGLGGLPRL